MTTFDLIPGGDVESPRDQRGDWADTRITTGDGRPPSPAQLRVREFIARYIATKRYPPTLREIQEALGFRSIASVHRHLTSLDRKGWIVRGEGGARSITVVKPGRRLGVPA